jgi:5'-3' exonuclease
MAILIDSGHLIHRLVFASQQAVVENPEFVTHLLLNSIIHNSEIFGASKHNQIIIAMDSTSWRKKWYEENKTEFIEYKAETYKGRRSKDSTIPWDKIHDVYNDVLKIIDQYSDFKVIKVDGAEADDIIAVATKYYKDKEDVWIISSDKDFVQLQSEDNINVYDPIKKQFKPRVSVEHFKKIHILIGDKSDNILPVRSRLGEKTAEKLIKDLDILLQTNPSIRERYNFNQKLIDLDYIPAEISNSIIEELNKPLHTFNAIELLKVFSKYSLIKLTDEVTKFKLKPSPIRTKLNSLNADKKAANNHIDSAIKDFFED